MTFWGGGGMALDFGERGGNGEDNSVRYAAVGFSVISAAHVNLKWRCSIYMEFSYPDFEVRPRLGLARP